MPNQYDSVTVRRFIDELVERIASEFQSNSKLNLVGIRTRGETLAARIEPALKERGLHQIGRGALDITLYRDDLSEIGPLPLVKPTNLNMHIDGVPMVLVDDVLFTGRTVRAALHQLSDFGRPSVIRLAVLVDRGGRELPIHPDFCSLTLGELPRDQRVKVKLIENDGTDEIIVGLRNAP
ncbi:MAG: bifunctional pyr operon transcriptional regulator/uracil phosphoribosyltransferase PyrR [Anaerolineae bacterium]|nr:bifunctional pyr operon transcriptional regulator/uracil phosphoribosyltransferase PyrR [Phycisphaerae bacterium]